MLGEAGERGIGPLDTTRYFQGSLVTNFVKPWIRGCQSRQERAIRILCGGVGGGEAEVCKELVIAHEPDSGTGFLCHLSSRALV